MILSILSKTILFISYPYHFFSPSRKTHIGRKLNPIASGLFTHRTVTHFYLNRSTETLERLGHSLWGNCHRLLKPSFVADLQFIYHHSSLYQLVRRTSAERKCLPENKNNLWSNSFRLSCCQGRQGYLYRKWLWIRGYQPVDSVQWNSAF